MITLVMLITGPSFAKEKSDKLDHKADGNKWSFTGDFYIHYYCCPS